MVGGFEPAWQKRNTLTRSVISIILRMQMIDFFFRLYEMFIFTNEEDWETVHD